MGTQHDKAIGREVKSPAEAEQATVHAGQDSTHRAHERMFALQREAGNDVVNRLVVGAADDSAERNAETRAHAAMATLFSAQGSDASPTLTPHASAGVRRRTSGSGGTIGAAGGELDAASSSEIDRHVGRRLDPGVAASYGAALSADVSKARVHDDAVADRLARRMSATAFTVGNDIFFSSGTYRPDHPDGAHLLAHELAHVAQNDGAAAHRSTVHRALGFEFETNVAVGKTESRFLGLGTKHEPLAKMEVIGDFVASHGVSMEADENSMWGSTIEFVIRPAIEENNRAGLVTAMDKIVALATALQNTPAPQGAVAGKPRTPMHGNVPGVNRQDVEFAPTAHVTANPQATVGVSVTKVGSVLSEMGKSGGGVAPVARELGVTHSTRFIDAAKQHVDLQNRPGMQGLVALLAAYMARGSTRSAAKPLNYAKLISSSVMVRTDFGSYYNKLPQNERTWAAGGTGRPGERLVKVTMDVLGWQLADASGKVFERGVRKSNKSDKNGQKSDKKLSLPELDVTREAWLLGIVGGNDALSAHFMNPKAKAQFEGLGRLGPAFDKVGGETQQNQASGAIMEMREMKQNADIGEWKKLALDIFDYIVAKNAPPQQPQNAPVLVPQAVQDDDESESEEDII